MFFFLLNFKYLEVPELLIFPTEIDATVIETFDLMATYAVMSHCSGNILSDNDVGGGYLKGFLGGDSFGYAFESTDRMQLISVSKSDELPSPYLGRSNEIQFDKVLACRATVFMDLLLFRRNLQMTFVSAEDKCEGCKVHIGYSRNFAALAPYFQISNDLVSQNDKIALVGASAGAVLGIFGAIELEGEGIAINMVQTFGMPRPGNKAFSSFVDELATFPTFALTYYRDPMPHIPPTILGYRQAASNYAWIYRPAAYQGRDSLARSTGFFKSSKLSMDHYLANRVFFFRIADHLMYFATKDILAQTRSVDDALTACGQYADETLAETHTSDLFYF